MHEEGQQDPSIFFLTVHLTVTFSTTSQQPALGTVKDQEEGKGEEAGEKPDRCKHCEKYEGNGYAHGLPNNIPHDKCNYNRRWKGWQPKWVCKKIGVDFKEFDDCSK